MCVILQMHRIDRRLAEADKPSAVQLYPESLLSSHPSDRSVSVDRVPSYTAPPSNSSASVKVGLILVFTFKHNSTQILMTQKSFQ